MEKIQIDFGGGGAFGFRPVAAEPVAAAPKDVEETTEEETTGEEINEDVEAPEESDELPTDEGGEDVDTGEEEGEEEGEDTPPNPFRFLAEQLKQEGALPEEFEVGDDVSAVDVYTSYKDRLSTSLREEIENEVKGSLQEKGFDEQTLLYATALRQNVDPRLLNRMSAHEAMASVTEDSEDTDKEAVIRAMYQYRGLDAQETETFIQAAKAGENIDDLFQKASQFHKQQHQQMAQQERQRQAETERQRQESTRKAEEFVRTTLKQRTVMGETFSPEQASELQKAIYEPTAILEVEGSKVQTTELKKFLYEFQTNPEIALYSFYLYKYRDKLEAKAKKEAKKEMDEEFLSGYKASFQKKKKKVAPKESPPEQRKVTSYTVG